MLGSFGENRRIRARCSLSTPSLVSHRFSLKISCASCMDFWPKRRFTLSIAFLCYRLSAIDFSSAQSLEQQKSTHWCTCHKAVSYQIKNGREKTRPFFTFFLIFGLFQRDYRFVQINVVAGDKELDLSRVNTPGAVGIIVAEG